MGQEITAAWKEAVQKSKQRFEALVKDAGANVNYATEALYATQALMNSTYLAGVANRNPVSLQMAIVNVAAVGLTLNPARGLAALVPRDNAVRLDIMYRGLVHIAVETGSILWAKAELVHSKDKFTYNGPAMVPTHVFDPFGDRGDIVGGYCLAKMPDGDYLVDVMAEAEFVKVRETSSAWTRNTEPSKKGPWQSWPDEMRKKTLIKRASKSWPAKTPRLAEAIKILNEDNGEGLDILAGEATVIEEAQQGDPAKVEEKARVYIDKTVERAWEAGAWEAARDYFAGRFRGHDLAYAMHALNVAETAAKSAQPSAESESADPAEHSSSHAASS